jgi:hypothetical protein
MLLVATPTAILSSALRYVLLRHCDPVGMVKPRNVNTADSTGTSLQTGAQSYKANEAFSIHNGKIMAVTTIRFPSLGMLAALFMVAFKGLFCREGKRIGVTALPRCA